MLLVWGLLYVHNAAGLIPSSILALTVAMQAWQVFLHSPHVQLIVHRVNCRSHAHLSVQSITHIIGHSTRYPNRHAYLTIWTHDVIMVFCPSCRPQMTRTRRSRACLRWEECMVIVLQGFAVVSFILCGLKSSFPYYGSCDTQCMCC